MGPRTMLIPDRRVAEVADLLIALPEGSDPLDLAELILELEEEYGRETVRLAVSFLEAAGIARVEK